MEISTGTGGLNPSLTNYYFSINRQTNRAEPKRLFRSKSGLPHSISSAMLLTELSELQLPPESAELRVIVGGRLAPAFSFYSEMDDGRIDNSGRKLSREILRWNGRFYLPSR